MTNKTTANDAMDGFTRYGVSTGTNAILLTGTHYEKVKNEIAEYLNKRFGNQWEIKSLPV